jgi:hypothetical protein
LRVERRIEKQRVLGGWLTLVPNKHHRDTVRFGVRALGGGEIIRDRTETKAGTTHCVVGKPHYASRVPDLHGLAVCGGDVSQGPDTHERTSSC